LTRVILYYLTYIIKCTLLVMFNTIFPIKTNLHENSMSVFLPSIHIAHRKSVLCNMSAKSCVRRVSGKLSSICLSIILSNVIKVLSFPTSPGAAPASQSQPYTRRPLQATRGVTLIAPGHLVQ